MNKENVGALSVRNTRKNLPNCAQKGNKGITLVALIITIIVLLILAVVTIKAVQGDGIIQHAKNSQAEYKAAQEVEQIKLALNEWKIVGNTNPAKTFLEFMGEKFGVDKVQAGSSENEVIVTLANGSQYKVTTSREVTLLDEEVEEEIPVGSYIQYNVEYEDMYSGINYNANNGWRYLGKDDNGNNLIVSTGIPAILYSQNAVETLPNWWATDAEIQADTGIYHTDAGWDYDNSGEPNKYAAYGLRYKFESIPFTYEESSTTASTANTGIFRKVGSTTSGNLSSNAFRASGVNVVDVHNLTLAELNRATNSASGSTIADTDISEGFKDLTGTANGLFDMRDLEDYGTSTQYSYWLASPTTWSRD